MISKIKDMFDVVKYRKKYNTLENKYEALLNKVAEISVKNLQEKENTKSMLKRLNDKLTELKERISDLETKKKK